MFIPTTEKFKYSLSLTCNTSSKLAEKFPLLSMRSTRVELISPAMGLRCSSLSGNGSERTSQLLSLYYILYVVCIGASGTRACKAALHR